MKNLLLICFVLITFIFVSTQPVSADGSRDLYPAGATGGRAAIFSHASQLSGNERGAWPWENLGVHYVYAKVGEYITLGVSSEGTGGNNKTAIRVYAPGGGINPTQTFNISGNATSGRIPDRVAELAGPEFPLVSTPTGGKFIPVTIQVETGQEGIWKVEFIGGSGATASGPLDNNKYNKEKADDAWSQPEKMYFISAWDVSVCKMNTGNDWEWLPGRVYTNIMTMSLSDSFEEGYGFESRMYVLTNDGYRYIVDGNGLSAVGFTYFVNNKGFRDANGNPIYKSVDDVDPTVHNAWNPNNADDATNFTHKMFYVKPADDLPLSSSGQVPGGSTWLKVPPVQPNPITVTVSDLTIVGKEGTVNTTDTVSNGTATITFNSSHSGRYVVTIEDNINPTPSFEPACISGNATIGLNTVQWDGKDGNGNPLPSGDWTLKVEVNSAYGQVHFPYLDMEINPRGIIIESYDETFTNVLSDIVFWDDSPITGGADSEKSNPITMLDGIESNINGHKWGTYSSSTTGSGNSGTGLYSFGHGKAMDTWTYYQGIKGENTVTFKVRVADLATTTTCRIVSISAGTIEYTVTVSNLSGTEAKDDVFGAPFSFTAPTGFTITSCSFNDAGGATESTAGTLNGLVYNSKLDIPIGKSGVYTIAVKRTAGVLVNGADYVGTSTIMRVIGVRDVDATTKDQAPVNPYTECGTADPPTCNNISFCSLKVPTIVATYDPHCVGGTMLITLEASEGAPTGIYRLHKGKFLNLLGEVLGTFTGNTLEISLTNYVSGTNHFHVSSDNAFVSDISIVLNPNQATWKTAPVNTTWEDGQNWTAGDGGEGGYPIWCTDVVIPSSAADYPTLVDGDECRDIHFDHGGSVGKIQKLKYRYATVDLTIAERSRWHMLSAPLKYMYSADYHADLTWEQAVPKLFMRYFNTEYKTGKLNPDGIAGASYGNFSKSFAKLEEPLNTALGYVVWLNPENNEAGNFNGTYHFPRRLSDGSDVEYKYHYGSGEFAGNVVPLQRGNPTSLTSAWTATSTPDQDNRYRFIYEGAASIDFPIKPERTEILGNPFMSHFDFEAFYNANNMEIQPYYRIWNGKEGQFFTYIIGGLTPVWTGLTGITTNTTDAVVSQNIAPMQSFFIETIRNASSVTIPEASSVADAGVQLRAGEESDLLRLFLTKGNAKSQAIVACRSNAKDKYDLNEDIFKLFSPDLTAPEIYTISDETAVEVNVLGMDQKQKMIPIGMKTNQTGEFTLSVTGWENFQIYDVEIWDVQANIHYDLSEIEHIKFNKDGSDNLEGRFYLVLSNKTPTGIDPVANQIRVSVNNKVVIVSSPQDKIDTINLYDLSGRLIYSQTKVNSNYTSFTPKITQGVCILEVITAGGVKSYKIKL